MRVLVLCRDAADYRSLIAGNDDTDIAFCTSPSSVNKPVDVLLAEPDFAADYLRADLKVRWIQSTWAGVRPIVEAVAQATSVPLVTGIRDVFGAQIAEYVMGYLLRNSRRAQLFEQQQADLVWNEVWPGTLAGKALTIIGTGSIGTCVARVARAFGMTVTGVSRSGDNYSPFDHSLPVDRCQEALTGADVVLATLPDTPDTQGLLSHQLLASMRDDSVFINVGRGSTVDENALTDIMAANPERRALLDVFQVEPLPRESRLWRLPNVTITPHISAVSFPQDIAKIFNENLRRFTSGQALHHLIDTTRGY